MRDPSPCTATSASRYTKFVASENLSSLSDVLQPNQCTKKSAKLCCVLNILGGAGETSREEMRYGEDLLKMRNKYATPRSRRSKSAMPSGGTPSWYIVCASLVRGIV
jgi:hypothetical protein